MRYGKGKEIYFLNYCLSIIISIVLVLSLIVNDTKFSYALEITGLSGNGTINNPYQISSSDDLTHLAKVVNSGNDCSSKYFELTNNIDVSNVPVIGTLNNNGQIRYF